MKTENATPDEHANAYYDMVYEELTQKKLYEPEIDLYSDEELKEMLKGG
jgi:hypothetical protein